jgi:hypothetical protein
MSVVKFTLELAGDVSSFTPSVQAQIQVVIAALAGVDPSAVDVTISPGSVIIDVRIQTYAVTAALVQSTMASATSSPSSATLMLANVTGVSITVLAVVTPPFVADISPPPPRSPSPPTTMPPSSTDALAASAVETSGSMGIIIGAVVGVIAVVGACIGVAIVLRRKRSRRPKQRGSVQDPSPGIVIELMASPTASPLDSGQRNHLQRGRPFESPTPMKSPPPPSDAPSDDVPPPPPEAPPYLTTADNSKVEAKLERARVANLKRVHAAVRERQSSRFATAVEGDQRSLASDPQRNPPADRI